MNRDFVHIGFVTETPFSIAPAMRTGTLSEFVAETREHPGGVFHAANSHGSLPHLKGEMLRHQTGANITFVPS